MPSESAEGAVQGVALVARVIDVDDLLPYAGLMYPGFDVYLGHTAGLIEHPTDSYTVLMQDPRYARRMRHHAARSFDRDGHLEYPF